MTQPTERACSRFPTDIPQEEELPEPTQQAQATTAGPYYSKRGKNEELEHDKQQTMLWHSDNVSLQINYCLTKYTLEKNLCILIGLRMAFQKHIYSYSYAKKKSTFTYVAKS